jgi:hypothetical protein
MPKLDINGQVYDVPDSWDSRKLEGFITETKGASKTSGAPQVASVAPQVPVDTRPTTKDNLEFAKDAAKTGTMRGISALGGLARGVGSMLGMNDDAPKGASVGERFSAGFDRANNAGGDVAKDVLGAKDYQPIDNLQKYGKQAIEGVTDLTNLALVNPVTAAAKGATLVARGLGIGAKAAQNAVVGAGVNVGAQAGKDTAEFAGLGPTGQMVASMFGGLSGANAGTVVAKVVPRGLQKAYDTVSPAFASKYLSGLKGAGSVSEAGGVLKDGVKAAIGDAGAKQASVALEGQLGVAVKEAGGVDELGGLIAKRTALSDELGTQVPITAVTGQNRALEEMTQKTVTGSPEFRKDLRGQTEATLEAIPKAVDAKIGSQADALETLDSYVPRSFLEVPVSQKRLADLKTDVDNLTSELASGVRSKSEVGAELQTKIAERQRLEQKAMTPEYNKVLSGAEDSGAKVTGDMIDATVGGSIRAAKEANLFATMPSLSRYAKVITEGQGGDISIRQLDGFKREVANQLRTVNYGSPEYRGLKDIQDSLKGKTYRAEDFSAPGVLLDGRKVDATPQADGSFVSQGLYERISPKFAQEYAAVDKEYARRIGEVFLEKAPMDIGRKEFASDVVPYALRTPEGMQQLMKAAGEDGGRLGTEVILTKLDDLIKAPGGITPAIISNFQKKYASQIEAVTKAGGDISDKLSSTKSALEANVAQQIGIRDRTAARVMEDVLTTGGVNSVGKRFTDPTSMVKHFKDSPGDLANWSKQVGANNPDQREAMGTAILQQYLSGSLPLSSLQADLVKNAPLRLLVGEKMGKVVELLELAQNISKVPAPQGSVLSSAPKDLVAKFIPGMDLKSTLAVLGSRLASTAQKGVTILRNVTSSKAKEQEIEQLRDLLSGNKVDAAVANLKAAQAAPKEESAGFIRTALQAVGSVAKENVVPYVRGVYSANANEGIDETQRQSEIESFFKGIKEQANGTP